MFDLEIFLSICTSNELYHRRYLDFMEWGLHNLSDKVHITLGCGPMDVPGNPKFNCPVDVLKCKSGHVACKTAEYCSKLPELVDAKWYIKVDDDSFTDISALLEILKDYDPEKHFYFVAGLNHNLDWPEHEIIKRFKLNKWTNNPDAKIWHEWECCVLSRGFVNEFKYSLVRNLFKERMKLEGGSSDQTLGIVGKILCVPPIDAHFLTERHLISYLSVYGGDLVHCHNIAHDRNAHFLDMLKRQLQGNQERTKYEFTTSKSKKIVVLELAGNGLIYGSLHKNESMWFAHGKNISFYSNEGELTTEFVKQQNGTYRGPYCYDKEIIHYLTRVE